MTAHLVYLHGFASGPGSVKAALLRERFAAEWASTQVPDLEGGDFYHLTLDGMRARASAAIDAVPVDGWPLLLAGSSLGGYLAAEAAQDAGRVDALLLMAPAFGFPSRWRAMLGEAGIAAWRAAGDMPFYHYVHERERPLAVDFLDSCETALDLPPPTPLPTTVLHGSDDESVDVAWSRRYCDQDAHLRFVELCSDHSLTDEASEAAIVVETQRMLADLAAQA